MMMVIKYCKINQICYKPAVVEAHRKCGIVKKVARLPTLEIQFHSSSSRILLTFRITCI